MRCADCKFFDPTVEPDGVEEWRGVCRIELPPWVFTMVGADRYDLNSPTQADDGCDLGKKSSS